ncbi:MAG: PorV/PorQ family protein [Bacteroidetes bacterium]|nr:PorV/PorQ family protein [Bacteroidota bacterium]MCW5896117.1 PorV/PorQ family protein [Bacteroidota bacterium]
MITRHLPIRICAVVAGVALLAMSASAGNRAGAVSGQFLKLPINARSAGMGNAQVSLAQGALSIATNPAGVLNIEGASFGSTYNQWWADITVAFFGATAKVEGWGTLGAGVTLLTTDEMNVTTPAFPEGTGQKFKASDVAYTVTYAKQISELFGLGLSAKFITSNLYNKEVSSNSVAFDIGTLYDIPVLRTRLGISVTNLGKDLRYINEQYSLPTALRFGATTALLQEEMHNVQAVFQIGRPNDSDEQYNVGLEYGFNETLYLRGGYKFNYDTEDFTGGLGVNLKSLGLNGAVDYAYSHYKFLPATHMFSIEIGF